MEAVSRLIANFLLGLFVVLFYKKIVTDDSMKWLCRLSVSPCFAACMFFSYMYIPEPIRSVCGVLVLGLLLWVWQRKVNWAALVLAFLCGYFLRLFSSLIATFFVVSFFGGFNGVLFILSLITDITAYFAAYRLIKLKKGIPYIDRIEIKGIIFASTGIILVPFGINHLIYNRVHEDNYAFFIAVVISLVFLIIGLAFLIIFLARRHKEGLESEAEIEELIAEKHEIEKEAEAEIKELIAAIHENKVVIPVLRQWMDEVKKTGLAGATGQLGAMMEMAEEISAEFADESLNISLKTLKLPTAWYALKVYLEEISKECRLEDIEISIQSSVKKDSWESLTISKVDFIRLVGNLLSNAKKEVGKADTNSKSIIVLFRDKYGAFEFEVHDTAPAFPVEVLRKLGQRGNSTNGTGNGYAEVFKFLKKYNASFTIFESGDDSDCYKRISVKLDGLSQISICTDYRYDLLQEALADTELKVHKY